MVESTAATARYLQHHKSSILLYRALAGYPASLGRGAREGRREGGRGREGEGEGGREREREGGRERE